MLAAAAFTPKGTIYGTRPVWAAKTSNVNVTRGYVGASADGVLCHVRYQTSFNTAAFGYHLLSSASTVSHQQIRALIAAETLELRWADIDLADSTVTMAMQLQRVAGELRHDETKTDDSTRVVALPRPCVQALRRHRAQQTTDRLAAGDRWTDSGLVFTTRKGTPIEPRNINRAFDALVA
jgi:hypothetical protein